MIQLNGIVILNPARRTQPSRLSKRITSMRSCHRPPRPRPPLPFAHAPPPMMIPIPSSMRPKIKFWLMVSTSPAIEGATAPSAMAAPSPIPIPISTPTAHGERHPSPHCGRPDLTMRGILSSFLWNGDKYGCGTRQRCPHPGQNLKCGPILCDGHVAPCNIRDQPPIYDVMEASPHQHGPTGPDVSKMGPGGV